jgi:hypothetical protein
MMNPNVKAVIDALGGPEEVGRRAELVRELLGASKVSPLVVLVALGVDAGMTWTVQDSPEMLVQLAGELIQYGFAVGRAGR